MVSFAKNFLFVDTLDRQPSVVFLPGHFFFAKSLELPQGMEGDELASYLEIAVEEHSPFPAGQIYHGVYHPEGARRALLFIAYRKRFSPEEKELWDEVDLVVPDYVSLLGLAPDEPRLCLLLRDDSVTGLYFDGDDPVPARVISRHLDAESSDEERAGVVSGLIERFKEEYGELPVERYRRGSEVSNRKGRLVFPLMETDAPAGGEDGEGQAGEEKDAAPAQEAMLQASMASEIDIRDNEFLVERRRTMVRNIWFWRSLVALLVLAGLLLIGEIAHFGMQRTLEARRQLEEERQGDVATIREQFDLAQRMEELGQTSLLPFEMLAVLNEYRPGSVYFRSTRTSGWNTLAAQAVTPYVRDVDRYEEALRQSGKLESVQIRDQRVQAGETTFVLEATFRRDALLGVDEVAWGSPARGSQPGGNP